MVLRAPERTATPANPKGARLSPLAVLQALKTNSSIGLLLSCSLVWRISPNSFTSRRLSQVRTNVSSALELNSP